jgi:hypothetical protein
VGLLDTLLQPIESLFNRIFGGTVVSRLVKKITQGVEHVTTLFDRITRLVESVKSEISEFSNWRENLTFKHRVINVPRAIEKSQDLVTGVRDAWQAILGLVRDFEETIKGGNAQAEAEEMAAEIGEVENIGASLLKRLPKLAKGLEKMLGVVTLIVDNVILWSDAIDKLQTIVDEVTRLREAVETGETIFLSQRNPRRIVQVVGGKSIKIRVGNLHS